MESLAIGRIIIKLKRQDTVEKTNAQKFSPSILLYIVFSKSDCKLEKCGYAIKLACNYMFFKLIWYLVIASE